jgi:hypothetical protein
VGKAGGVETHHIFCRDIAECEAREPTREFQVLRAVRCLADAAALGTVVRKQLEEHLASDAASLASKGSKIYYLASGDTVVSQLLISPGPLIELDVPRGTELDIGTDRAFLSYLYTPLARRRTGAARRLLRLVCAELARQGTAGLVAHVRATNVPSLNAFRASGWERIGTVWTRRSRRWLRYSGLDARGVSVKLVPERDPK